MRKIFIIIAVLLPNIVFAQDLTIDYRFNVAGPDPRNYLTFKSSMRYIEVNQDTLDAVTGASKLKSTSLIAPLQYDIMGNNTISGGFRGLMLFPVSPTQLRVDDGFRANKEGNIITIEYCHRGVAYRIQTDQRGNITFPRGSYVKRTIGYIRGPGPQVISTDFSTDQTYRTIDWRKVWDPQTPSGNVIVAGENDKTGSILNDFGDLMAMYNWDGALAVTLDNSILTIKGTLRPVKR